SGSITLSTPQDIATTSSPTFNDLTLSSLNTIPISDYVITPATQDLNMNSHSISNVTNLNGTAMSAYLINPINQDVNFNNHLISNISQIEPNSTNVNIGNTTSIAALATGDIVIGD